MEQNHVKSIKYLEQNYYVTSRLVPQHLKSALENGVRSQLVKSNSPFTFQENDEENTFENKELILVQEMGRLPSSLLPKGF